MLRIVFFAVPFAVLFFIGWPWWLALAISTLIALALSVIFLSKQRSTASSSIYEWRMRERTADDIVEDEAVDAADMHTREPAAAAESDRSLAAESGDANAAHEASGFDPGTPQEK